MKHGNHAGKKHNGNWRNGRNSHGDVWEHGRTYAYGHVECQPCEEVGLRKRLRQFGAYVAKSGQNGDYAKLTIAYPRDGIERMISIYENVIAYFEGKKTGEMEFSY